MDRKTMTVDEEMSLLDLDWVCEYGGCRLWPRAESHPGSSPGEWNLTIRGTEAEFVEIHKGLIVAGYGVDETCVDEVYTRYRENGVETMIDVWELQCEALDADLLFDNYDDLLTCLSGELELAEDDEPLQFAVVRQQMTQDEYDNLEEVEP